MLFNEPKLLKSLPDASGAAAGSGFSALQRAEIAEMRRRARDGRRRSNRRFSALQRAEIAEIDDNADLRSERLCFSALQRAEIAEIQPNALARIPVVRFSALQRAEIAEMEPGT